MTIQEALEIIKNEMPYESGVITEALNMVENAVEKQIPKKPTSFNRTAHDFLTGYCKHSGNYCEYIKPYSYEYKYTDYKCPCCEHLCSDGIPNFCCHCGQALDFGDLSFG